MTIALPALLTEHWIALTLLLLVFGIGFWGGVLQHAHLGPGDGGTLDRPLILRRDVTFASAVNTAALTTVLTHTIPANTILVGMGLRIYAHGFILQNTLTAQASPLIRISIGGATVLQFPAAAIPALANQPGARIWSMELFLMNNFTNDARGFGMARLLSVLTSTGDPAPLLIDYANCLASINFTTSKNVLIEIQNPVADPSYETSKVLCMIEQV